MKKITRRYIGTPRMFYTCNYKNCGGIGKYILVTWDKMLQGYQRQMYLCIHHVLLAVKTPSLAYKEPANRIGYYSPFRYASFRTFGS